MSGGVLRYIGGLLGRRNDALATFLQLNLEIFPDMLKEDLAISWALKNRLKSW